MNEHFEASLATSEQPVVTDFSCQSSTLLVAFGGIAAGMGMPPFEFFRIAAEIPVKKMFVRDLEQAWYHRGLPGVSDDVRSTAEYLRRQMAQQAVSRTVFVGNSMGGYAAILFGWLLGVDVVHAFAPQTFVGPLRRLWHFDRRWRHELRRLHRVPGLTRDHFDLRRVLKTSQQSTMIHLHFADEHRLDRLHSRRMQDLRNVQLHAFGARTHNLIKQLRDNGTLRELLLRSLADSRSQAA